MRLVPRLLRAPNKSFFLFGPRGTGKSTWLRHTFPPDVCRIDLLHEENYQALLADPSLLAKQLAALEPESTVIIDEVQRLPILLNQAHRFIEERALRFVLCGSSARKLKQAGTNLLAGRALTRSMHPFLPQELGDAFSLEEALRWGLLPVVWADEDKQETLLAYARTYLKEEIQAEALVRNLPGFSRFLPIAALFHGQNINITGIARDAGVARTTIAGYLDVLEDTLLSFRLYGYEAKLRLRERKLPKLYWADPGIVRAVRKRFGDLHPEEDGALFEGFVLQTLRANIAYQSLPDDIYYWASSEAKSVEVDFLVKREDSLVAIEAKSGTRFCEGWCRGLRAVASLDGLCRRIIVYPDGPRLRTDDGIDILPFREFADLAAANQLFG